MNCALKLEEGWRSVSLMIIVERRKNVDGCSAVPFKKCWVWLLYGFVDLEIVCDGSCTDRNLAVALQADCEECTAQPQSKQDVICSAFVMFS